MSKAILEEVLQESSKNIAQYVASSAFEFWQRKDFRLYVEFANVSQTEQDRMFNELEVSLIGLIMLGFDDGITTGQKEKKIVLSTLREQLPIQFLAIMKDVGIDEKNLKVWEKLIDLRLKEYREDVKLARKTSKNWKELGDDVKLRGVWSRVETITIDCLSHIRRGDVKEGDPLWKLLRKWFTTIEGTVGQISSLEEEEKKDN